MGRSAGINRIAALAVLGIALLAGGLWIGSIVRGDQIDRLAPDGALLEVHLADGTVYLGALEDEGDYLQLTGPAVIVPGSTEEETTSYAVQPLSGDPYRIVGPILIDPARVAFIGAVSAGSGIERAYHDAMSAQPEGSPAPS
jgi:hypothetical protein